MRKITYNAGGVYRVYNHGVDNRLLFSSQEDYDRFEAYLYLLNDSDSPRAANFFVANRSREIFKSARGEPLVHIAAYAILQNHFEILMSPLQADGISKFMQKLLTAYTMYFNNKYDRRGTLFEGSYKVEESKNDEHTKYLFSYIHMLPAQLFDARWEDASNEIFAQHATRIAEYRYSSVREYLENKHTITNPSAIAVALRNSRSIQTQLSLYLKGRIKYKIASL